MKPRDIEAGVVAYLSSLAEGAKPHTGDMRRSIGCTNPEMADAVMRMRMAGKIDFHQLKLSPSMMAQAVPMPEPVAPPAPQKAVLLSPAEQLLRDIEAYCDRTGTRSAEIGRRLFGHLGYVGLLRKNRSTTPEKIAAVRGDVRKVS